MTKQFIGAWIIAIVGFSIGLYMEWKDKR